MNEIDDTFSVRIHKRSHCSWHKSFDLTFDIVYVVVNHTIICTNCKMFDEKVHQTVQTCSNIEFSLFYSKKCLMKICSGTYFIKHHQTRIFLLFWKMWKFYTYTNRSNISSNIRKQRCLNNALKTWKLCVKTGIEQRRSSLTREMKRNIRNVKDSDPYCFIRN